MKKSDCSDGPLFIFGWRFFYVYNENCLCSDLDQIDWKFFKCKVFVPSASSHDVRAFSFLGVTLQFSRSGGIGYESMFCAHNAKWRKGIWIKLPARYKQWSDSNFWFGRQCTAIKSAQSLCDLECRGLVLLNQPTNKVHPEYFGNVQVHCQNLLLVAFVGMPSFRRRVFTWIGFKPYIFEISRRG